jgi:hypothetical protein
MYAQLCRKHLEPAPFGAITLDRLRPTDIEALVLKLKDRELSDSTVRSVYTVLRLALDGAVRDGLLARNPAAVVKRPGLARREAKHATAVDVTALLKAADGLRYRDVLLLIAATGMRRGEALAVALERRGPRQRDGDCARHPRPHRRASGRVRAQDGPLPTHRAHVLAVPIAKPASMAAAAILGVTLIVLPHLSANLHLLSCSAGYHRGGQRVPEFGKYSG